MVIQNPRTTEEPPGTPHKPGQTGPGPSPKGIVRPPRSDVQGPGAQKTHFRPQTPKERKYWDSRFSQRGGTVRSLT